LRLVQGHRAQNDATKLKGTNALFQFNLASDGAVWKERPRACTAHTILTYRVLPMFTQLVTGQEGTTPVRVEFSQDQLIGFYNQLEIIQQQLDAVQR